MLLDHISVEEIGPWKKLSDKVVYDNPWISVHHQEVLNPNGNPGIYGKVHFKNLAIGIIPLDEDWNTWVVGQFRYPLNAYSWEIPEGGGKLGVDPLESAKRELLEECGLVATDWSVIQEMHLSNSVSDEFGLIYVARNLSQHQAEPEDTEMLQVKKIPFSELVKMVLHGEITDSLTVAGVLKLELMRMQQKL